jgi:pyrimidine-specific ribonucleoside hydrolase
MNDLIVETDLGRDPDDFFALCYLVEAGVRLRAVVISPGDHDQIAVAKGLLHALGVDVPVGSARPESAKSSVGGVHHEFIARYGYAPRVAPDGWGHDVIAAVMRENPDTELFVCGPMQNVGRYLSAGGRPFPRATVQGGFVPYSAHDRDVVRMERFEGRDRAGTFNLNGDVKAALAFIACGTPARFVGKNVCHTVVYDKAVHETMCALTPKHRAGEILREFMGVYLERHEEGKKFHDPTAAVCHLHPEVGVWLEGTPYREKGEWGFRVETSAHRGLADVDRDALWRHLREGT